MNSLSNPQRHDCLSGSTAGVFLIAATPFTDTGALDLASTDRLVEFYLEHGATGLTILGMMGEAAKLSPEEGGRFLHHVLARVRGRVPVIVGVSNPGTDNLVAFASDAMAAGAAGVMIAPLPSLRTDEQIVAYFTDVCGRLGDIPVVLQDYPQATSVVLSVPTIERILELCPTIVCFKHEDCPGLNKLSALRLGDAGRRRRLSILVGNSGLFLPQEMARGADGAMTGFAYPEVLAGVCGAYLAGDAAAGEDLFDLYLPLVRYESQPGLGLAIRKEVLRRRGAIASAHVRAPGPKLKPTDHHELAGLMARLDRKLAQHRVSLPAC